MAGYFTTSLKMFCIVATPGVIICLLPVYDISAAHVVLISSRTAGPLMRIAWLR